MNKIALVTGGTSGIGKEIVRTLLDDGNKVITCYKRDEKRAKEVEKEFNNSNLLIVKCDVSNEEGVIKMYEEIESKFGKIDYLVNNAGTNIDGFIKDYKIDDFKHILDVNLLGKAIPTKHAYRHMNEGGSIVNIASRLGVKPCAESPAYCACAAAIINFTKATSLEFSDKKIRVNSISPGLTITPLSLAGWTEKEIEETKNNNPLKRLGRVEDIAEICMFLLSEKAGYITGENILVTGGSV